jgi:hypothetical protein
MNHITPELNNICDGCPAAFALGAYAQNAGETQSISPVHAEMLQHEAQVAGRTLDTAAGRIACKDLRKKPFAEFPETVPETGSRELIALIAQCPAMPYYLNERTGQPLLLAKAMFTASKIVVNLRRKT